jgi:hypothetical protein
MFCVHDKNIYIKILNIILIEYTEYNSWHVQNIHLILQTVI